MPALPHRSLRVFVATLPEHVPTDGAPFVSIDGSVQSAAVTWDHHVTGEPINLDAMPGAIDAAGFRGIGTTLADTDALASVVAVMAGGVARLPTTALAILRAASHRCDHLVSLPGVDAEVDRLGLGLHGWVGDALAAATDPRASDTFARLCGAVADDVASGRALPFDTSTHDSMADAAAQLDDGGRIRRGAGVALVDLRGVPRIAPEAYYARFPQPVAVAVDDHPQGGPRYTVGVNPFAPERPSDLGSCLAALAGEEFAHGPPARLARPGPGSENWGGRATVFGSPWNYGSRLTPERVAEIIAATLPPG
ncbi:MAG: hypothetical protein Q8S73_20445 [Deltaproteobacteria bacterium]|nr:hypothetical protein [Myxococcales bacterium]MDP3216490.1 hypothetical protein [Deltaproteobacteria bacterium]